MRATEIKKGSIRGNPELNGQWNKYKMYCPECHRCYSNSVYSEHIENIPHAIKGCTGTFVRISPTARLPRKNASKQQWKYFNIKFIKRKD